MGARGRRGRACVRLRRRRHRRVHRLARPARRVLLHGDEHPAAGRAPGHRAGRPGSTSSSEQLRVAAGEPLRVAQATSRLTGHAVEARVYAEDPARGFLPTGGRVLALREPVGEHVRVDSGVAEGDLVGPTTTRCSPRSSPGVPTGPRRCAASTARSPTRSLLGVGTNVAFLRALLRHPDVVAGRSRHRSGRAVSRPPSAHVPDDVAGRPRALAGLLRLPDGAEAAPVRAAGRSALGGVPMRWQLVPVGVDKLEPIDVAVRGRADAATVSIAEWLQLKRHWVTCRGEPGQPSGDSRSGLCNPVTARRQPRSLLHHARSARCSIRLEADQAPPDRPRQ